MNILDSIVAAYEQASINLYGNLLFEAQVIFAILAAADFAWSLIVWARRGRGALVTDLGTRLFVLGLFFFLMRFYLSTIGRLPTLFLDTAAQLLGAGSFSAGAILQDGISYGTLIFDKTNNLAIMFLAAMLMRVFALIVILVAFLIIAIRYIFTLVEQHIALGVGVFLFAFSGSRWTWTIADGFLRYVVNVAIRLFLIVVLVDVGKTLTIEWSLAFADNDQLTFEEFVVFVTAPVAFAWMVWSIPNRLADTVTQHFHLPSPYAS